MCKFLYGEFKLPQFGMGNAACIIRRGYLWIVVNDFVTIPEHALTIGQAGNLVAALAVYTHRNDILRIISGREKTLNEAADQLMV